MIVRWRGVHHGAGRFCSSAANQGQPRSVCAAFAQAFTVVGSGIFGCGNSSCRSGRLDLFRCVVGQQCSGCAARLEQTSASLTTLSVFVMFLRLMIRRAWRRCFIGLLCIAA